MEEGSDHSDSDSPGDSLRDIQDISLNLKLSLDVGNTLDGTLDSEQVATNAKKKLEASVSKLSKPMEKAEDDVFNLKFPAIRRRKYVFVIAVDCVATSDLLQIIKSVFSAAGEQRAAGSFGFILSTALTLSEVNSLLESGGLSPADFDAFICNSGSELYYSSTGSEENYARSPFVLDEDYHSHIDYRWGAEGLRRTLLRWTASVNEKKGANAGQTVSEDEYISSDHCYAFKVNDFTSVMSFIICLLTRISYSKSFFPCTHTYAELYVFFFYIITLNFTALKLLIRIDVQTA